MKKYKKKFIIIILVLIIFGLYNIYWYQTTHSKYSSYIGGMNEFVRNKSYILQDTEGYLFNVKYPDYLSYTGNLGISTEEGKLSLIIWPGMFKSTKYGLRITTNDNVVYNILLDKNANAIDKQYDELIKENRTAIQLLFQKANNQWNLDISMEGA